ncbi:MAG TPA: FMN-binding glutamate synthase family protein [Candidatus Acidoferrales bacterium]|nr:FMN-binding glutamate synthase family protein [Candidatus Acidoferrales bacterium]
MRKIRYYEYNDPSNYKKMLDLKKISVLNKSLYEGMGSLKKIPNDLDMLNFLPAQLYTFPLVSDELVNTNTSIGSRSKKGIHLETPIMLTAMSLGSLPKEQKLALAKASTMAGSAANTGEGGMLDAEREAARYLTLQYASGRFGVWQERLKQADMIELRISQAAYPATGSFVPGHKVTELIAKARGVSVGTDAKSPARHIDINSAEDLKDRISWLRDVTGGKPIGIKFASGRVEKDLDVIMFAEPDYIVTDGFGGGSGAPPMHIRDNFGVPLINFLPRAHRYLSESGYRDKVELIAAGRLRTSGDFAKCLALGADAVYIGTAALWAMSCEYYRMCETNECPTGTTTQDPTLIQRFDVDTGAKKLANFIHVSTYEIANIARAVGKDDVHKLDKYDLVALTKGAGELSGVTYPEIF